MAAQPDDWKELYDPEFVAEIVKLCAENIAFMGLEDAIMKGTYEALLASFNGATKAEVLAAAQENAARLVTGISEQAMALMADKIAIALESQSGIVKLARELKDGLGLDSNREKSLAKFKAQLEKDGVTGADFDKAVEKERLRLIDERAKVIAQNEMGNALEAGALAQAHSEECTHKGWICEPNACGDCQANQAQGVIPINEPFSTGDDTAGAHPHCFCSVYFVKDTGGGELERAMQRAQDRADKQAAAAAEGA